MTDNVKAKRVRTRTGYVMVELTPDERKKLERLREKRCAVTGERITLAGVFRHFLREAK